MKILYKALLISSILRNGDDKGQNSTKKSTETRNGKGMNMCIMFLFNFSWSGKISAKYYNTVSYKNFDLCQILAF